MDIATVLGVILGFFVIIGTILYEGNLGMFFNIPAIAIVFGGMTCATMIHFSMKQFLGIFSVVKKTLLHKTAPAGAYPKNGQLRGHQQARRRPCAGAGNTRNQSAFMLKGLQMLIDGQEEETIRELMELEMQYLEERHATGKKILEFMGASCPSFAMVGTLIGLVSMLSKMESPDEVGRGMAVALICTFYGALFANLYFFLLQASSANIPKLRKYLWK